MTPGSEDFKSIPDYSEKDLDSTSFTVPQAGKTYRIHHHRTHQVISLVDGKVQLQRDLDTPGGGWFWTCVERNGWLGFKNHVSGTFLGLAPDPKYGLHSKVTHHKAHEWFCIRLSPYGGYKLLVHYYSKEKLWKLDCKDGKTLSVTNGPGITWQFEEI